MKVGKRKKMKPFTNGVKEVIFKIKEYPEIYDPSNEGFRDPVIRQRKWEEIADQLGLTVIRAKNKWRMIRERYVRVRRLLNLGHIEMDEIKFPDFNLLAFLNPHIKNKKKYQNKQDYPQRRIQKIELNETTKLKESEYDSTQSDHFSNNSFTETKIPFLEEFLSNFEEADCDEQYMEKNESDKNKNYNKIGSNDKLRGQEQSADDLFCKMLSISLQSLSRLNNIKAKSEIFQILQKYIEKEEND